MYKREATRLTTFRPAGDLDGALSETLVIDGQTLANLEILENANGEPQVCPAPPCPPITVFLRILVYLVMWIGVL